MNFFEKFFFATPWLVYIYIKPSAFFSGYEFFISQRPSLHNVLFSVFYSFRFRWKIGYRKSRCKFEMRSHYLGFLNYLLYKLKSLILFLKSSHTNLYFLLVVLLRDYFISQTPLVPFKSWYNKNHWIMCFTFTLYLDQQELWVYRIKYHICTNRGFNFSN